MLKASVSEVDREGVSITLEKSPGDCSHLALPLAIEGVPQCSVSQGSTMEPGHDVAAFYSTGGGYGYYEQPADGLHGHYDAQLGLYTGECNPSLFSDLFLCCHT